MTGAYLVVVGSSGSGKTTLVDGLRTPAYSHRVVVPRRFVTRSGRRDDHREENRNLSHAAFETLLDGGHINPHWERPLEHGRTERYGFETVDEADPRLRVLSANNAFLRDGNLSVLEVLERALLVIVTSRRVTREARLQAKEMSADERHVRLGDAGEDLRDANRVAWVVDTSELTAADGRRALRAIVEEILASRLAAI